MEEEKYLFRRQYIIAPRKIQIGPSWNHLKAGENIHISAHPDIELTRADRGEKILFLIGFIFNHQKTAETNQEILEGILEKAEDLNSLFDLFDSKSGRFVVIARFGKEYILFNDASGFRNIYYYRDVSGNYWYASQPGLIAERCNVELDYDNQEDLNTLPLFRNTSEYWFPGTLSAYRGIFNLVPNHYMDMQTGRTRRFWPRRQVKKYELKECIDTVVPMLQSHIEASVHRFHTAFTITAGLDTRILLAASRKYTEDLTFLTHTHPALLPQNPDIVIPRKILRDNNIPHTIVHHREKIDECFKSISRRNVIYARESKVMNAFTFNQYFLEEKQEPLVLNGVCSELTRTFYRLPVYAKLTDKLLCALAGMSGSSVARTQFRQWLDGVGAYSSYGVRVLDLFYWENRNAKWPGYNEYDIAFDSYSPFNCRKLVEIMLGVDLKFRIPPHFHLHRELIKAMWPELLEYPINPPQSFREMAANKLRGTKLFETARFLKIMLRMRS